MKIQKKLQVKSSIQIFYCYTGKLHVLCQLSSLNKLHNLKNALGRITNYEKFDIKKNEI